METSTLVHELMSLEKYLYVSDLENLCTFVVFMGGPVVFILPHHKG